MFGRRSDQGALLVEHGQVLCPLRGEDRDTDDCTQCGFLRSISTEGEVTLLRCRPPMRAGDPTGALRYHLPAW